MKRSFLAWQRLAQERWWKNQLVMREREVALLEGKIRGFEKRPIQVPAGAPAAAYYASCMTSGVRQCDCACLERKHCFLMQVDLGSPFTVVVCRMFRLCCSIHAGAAEAPHACGPAGVVCWRSWAQGQAAGDGPRWPLLGKAAAGQGMELMVRPLVQVDNAVLANAVESHAASMFTSHQSCLYYKRAGIVDSSLCQFIKAFVARVTHYGCIVCCAALQG
jgi:hypothetical protein